jgi:hypothetical protein
MEAQAGSEIESIVTTAGLIEAPSGQRSSSG